MNLPDEPISEEAAERIALALEAFLVALVVVILVLFFWTVTG